MKIKTYDDLKKDYSKNIDNIDMDFKSYALTELMNGDPKHKFTNIINKIKKISADAYEFTRKVILTHYSKHDPKYAKKVVPYDLQNMFQILDHAFKFTIANFSALNVPSDELPNVYLQNIKPFTQKLLNEKIRIFKGMKFNLAIKIKVWRDVSGQYEYMFANFTIKNQQLNTAIDDDNDMISNLHENLLKKFDDFLKNGSQWQFERVNNYYVNILKYNPLKGSSYVELPAKFKNTKACLNIVNKDDKCFKYCLAASLYPVEKHAERPSSYKNSLDLIKDVGVTYPVSIKDYPKFEKQNNVKINVFNVETEVIKKEIDYTIHPLYSNKEDPYNAINILLYKNHYVLIKNFNKLMFSFSKHKGGKHFCMRCLHCCSSSEVLEEHKKFCNNFEIGVEELPGLKDNVVEFRNFANKLKVPFVIYADFECLLTPDDFHYGKNESSCRYQKHVPCGFTYYIVSIDSNYNPKPVVYRGEQAEHELVKCLLDEQNQLIERICTNNKMIFTDEDSINFKNSIVCHICDKELNGDKVRDHCHITGNYRGAAHNECNLNFINKLEIPVIFHNLKNYDAHFIMQCASEYNSKISCIPLDLEKYISFKIDKLKFIDSLQFMDTSLDSLSSNLRKQGLESFVNTSKYYNNEQLELITKKGVYPYDYMDSFNRFSETQLPPKEMFYSKLNEEEITDEKYAHAQKVWKTFNCINLGDYHDLYVKSDVLILADVFENFRNTCMSIYKLDPCHYYTAPGLSWDAMLYKTGVELELLTDSEMYRFIERGMRGGISTITKRYAKANNKYMKDFKPEEESSYIIYLDANNLYGWAMSQCLPISNFKWCNKTIDVMTIPDDNDIGYICDVDIEIPNEVHDKLNDYPIPETMLVTDSMLSPYQTNLKTKLNIKSDAVEKLVPNLMNKSNYVSHYRNLKKFIQLGCKITKFNKIIQFKQSPWLKQYIDFNTSMRAKATNDFEKDFYKLMNNSVFGKTMENVRKHIDAKIATTEQQKNRMINNPRCKTQRIFNENMVIFELFKKKVVLNKPIYAGFSILELSKVHMMNFHYDFIVEKYGKNAELLFTDTDSLTYHIKTEDLYKDMYDNKELFDFSDYTISKFNDNTNKKVIGKFKDETLGKPIKEFVGLRAKCYSILQDNDKQKNTSKGTSQCVKNKYLKHEKYLNVLQLQTQEHNIQRGFRTDKHQIYTVESNKISLSSYDNKRYLLENGFSSRAFGHYLNN